MSRLLIIGVSDAGIGEALRARGIDPVMRRHPRRGGHLLQRQHLWPAVPLERRGRGLAWCIMIKQRMLFTCTDNSAQSHMAEGLHELLASRDSWTL